MKKILLITVLAAMTMGGLMAQEPKLDRDHQQKLEKEALEINSSTNYEALTEMLSLKLREQVPLGLEIVSWCSTYNKVATDHPKFQDYFYLVKLSAVIAARVAMLAAY